MTTIATECNRCPKGIKACTHMDGLWVRLSDKEQAFDDAPYGVFWSWPTGCESVGFYYETEELARAYFDEQDREMRSERRCALLRSEL